MNFYDWCKENNKEILLAEWHGEKNLLLTPKDVAKASNKIVWWKCSCCGHEWQSNVNQRYRGGGCRKCGYRRVSISRRTPKAGHALQDKCPELSVEWHPTKNGDVTPSQVPFKSNRKAWWLGRCGHEWEASICGRTGGNGCPVCANLKIIEGYNDLASTFPEVAAEWHPTKNGNLTAKDVVSKANKKVWWQCSLCGHEWEAVIARRANGHGCPKCAKGQWTSFPEKAIAYYLGLVGLDVCENYRADWLENFELDIFIPSLNLGIEYDGYAWHQNAMRDETKNRLCQDKGVHLIRIREDGCVPIDGNDGMFYYLSGRSDQHLNEAIQYLFNTIENDFGFRSPNAIKIDVVTDRMEIYKLIEFRTRESSLAAAFPELVFEWNYERNGALQPELVLPYSDKKVWWKCQKHGHEWEAVVKSRSKGRSCPICSGNRVLIGFNDLASAAPMLALEWHPTKNHPLTAGEVTPQSGYKAWWKCTVCQHEWQATVYSRNGMGKGCPECAKKRVHEKLKTPKPGMSLQERNPILALEWHPTKNIDLHPTQVTLKTHRKVWWLGVCGHEWEAAVYSRSAGNGCPVCYQIKRQTCIGK